MYYTKEKKKKNPKALKPFLNMFTNFKILSYSLYAFTQHHYRKVLLLNKIPQAFIPFTIHFFSF